jgi:hypothetical protein
LEGKYRRAVACSSKKVNDGKRLPLMKRGDGPARLFAQGWLPFQNIWMRTTPDRSKMPSLA